MITISVIIFLIYAELIVWAIRGIQKLTAASASSIPSEATKKISIVIPFRNEEHRLSPLLESLKLLPDPASVEFIFMDDASEDRSSALIHTALENSEFDYRISKVIRKHKAAKKDAITQAIGLAKYPWIATFDADISIQAGWWAQLQNALQNNPDLILGPITLKPQDGLLHWVQEVETAGISQLGRGAAGLGRPSVANGAHLIYNKAWFESVNGFEGNLHIASGDDMFLLKKAVANEAEIHYLNDTAAVVEVQGAKTWPEYFWQRIRWVKKSKEVALQGSNRMGIAVTLANLWPIVLLFGLKFDSSLKTILLFYLFLKITLDFILISYRSLAPLHQTAKKTFVANLLYPWTLVVILVRSLNHSYLWKGREYKK
ncbi:glycosyltransferase [Gilvibacter sediminis]|uniref:glycosyltransferase n=1 Tax=Gilvibacter sediminis TaxID=379071 RepID=UPI0023509ABA|nr:glycosyltransferase [Gilvibacter sediminis]MDC7997271.1 glycosyltransferase [Gilvibacter sediminis]